MRYIFAEPKMKRTLYLEGLQGLHVVDHRRIAVAFVLYIAETWYASMVV